MADMFQFPKFSTDRRQIAMFRTPAPNRDEDQVRRLAATYGMDAEARDQGHRLALRDARTMLEVFYASDSVWWTDLTESSKEMTQAPKLPGRDQATALAESFLQERSMSDKRASVRSVKFTEQSRMDRGQKEPVSFATAVHVNYGFSV